MNEKFKYIYGPVNSWRLGRSLGIDLISDKGKVCNFNCIYCQLGPTKELFTVRKIYVETKKVLQEFKQLYKEVETDYITFSGSGEPTLALNLGEVIEGIKDIQDEPPIAVLTNSCFIHREDVKEDLRKADFVAFKLDAFSESGLRKINKPPDNIKLKDILKGIKNFKEGFNGKLALQIMFVPENKNEAKKGVEIANQIQPHEIQVNTPLRPCDEEPLSREELKDIKQEFKNFNVIEVYECKNNASGEVEAIDEEEVEKRRS